jgi:hypothetical protein
MPSVRSSAQARPRATPRARLLGLLLDPIDWLSETIYSVLIVLTFTLAYEVVRFGDGASQSLSAAYLNELLIAALSCALAWGLIDGVMYILIEVFQRGERHRLLQQIQAAESEPAGLAVIAEELDFIVEPIADEAAREALYRSVYAHLRLGEPRPVGFKREDFAGALGCVLVAGLAVLPSLLPLLLLRDNYLLAIRLSNIVSFVVLFAAGYRWGIHTGANPWKTGLLLVAVAALMVAIALPLGG